ncbi:MAG: helix-turn-helix domain-containing protein [Candidatus Azobacteroides sp.]|nr:helix-turn-helix domain-containing protein [Candidatus Azobacteroides sp.]
MHDRIKRIIEEKGLQASSFADKIQVSRGTISHILNGRMINGVRIYNDPSKDTIEKILITFPDISPSWFLRGEVPMYIPEQAFIQPTLTSISKPVQTDLFDEKKPAQLLEQPQGREYSQKSEDKMPESKTNSPIIQDINLSNNISKKIDKIIIFFSDKTFMTFISEE